MKRAAGPGRDNRGRGALAAWLLACALALLLSACGFHLRGAVVLPPAMERTYLGGTSAHGPLGMEIANALSRAGGRVVEQAQSATAVLQIQGEETSRRVLTVDQSGQASQYELYYQVSFALLRPSGEVIAPGQTIGLTRTYAFNPSSVLSADEEANQLLREMRGQAVRQMLRRLQSAARFTPAG